MRPILSASSSRPAAGDHRAQVDDLEVDELSGAARALLVSADHEPQRALVAGQWCTA
jgi:hypothetical protein